MTHVGTKQAVLNLVKVMEDSIEIGFNMHDWVDNDRKGDSFLDMGDHECKTTCCFAGFAVYGLKTDGTVRDHLSKRKTFLARLRDRFYLGHWDGSKSLDGQRIVDYAEEALSLSHVEAYELFQPDGFELNSVTLKQGIKVLKNFARTGEIEWNRYLRKNQLTL